MFRNDSDTPTLRLGLEKIIGFFKGSRNSHGADLDMKNHLHFEPSDKRAVCGGFNEAFIMQYWASYGPYH